MAISNKPRPSFAATCFALAGALAFSSCDGSSGGGTTDPDLQPDGSRATLLSVDYGRLVDIYSYRRIDDSNPDRRDSRNRMPVLIQENALVSSVIGDDELFDAIGGERLQADFRFLPFDSSVGHEELIILWDDTDPIEQVRFQEALAEATSGLDVVPASFRSQDTSVRPIPVVPRNAAIRLNFDRELSVNESFFRVNPRAVQLLQFLDDPSTSTPQQAFLPVPFRVLTSGRSLILDTTLIGGEASGVTSTGLAASDDSVTANFRIAIPTQGIGELLRVEEDTIPGLNGVDSSGNAAIIRDFRSGNSGDGRVGALSDTQAPSLVGRFEMGILDVDTDNNILTINKRGNRVAIRGRIPFVDGAIVEATGVPGGRSTVPTLNASQTRERLVSGDRIQQEVTTSTGEVVTIRAQVIENLDVGRTLGDATFPAPGLAQDGSDGGDLPVARIRVDRISALDSAGNPVTMVGDAANPNGLDCLADVRYYEFVPYSPEFGVTAAVSDAGRRLEFVNFTPGSNAPLGTPDSPEALRFADPSIEVGFRFSEPMDLSVISTLDNLVYTKGDVDVTNFLDALASPKSASINFVPSRLVDVEADGTVLRLLTPLGHYHEEGQAELYWAHVLLDDIRDVSGNRVDIFDRREPGDVDVSFRSGGSVVQGVVQAPLRTFSVQFELDPMQADNLVGSRIYRFEAGDEDGSAPGSTDLYGQFQLSDGRLTAAQTSRFQRTSDRANLQGIDRFMRGECVGVNMMGEIVFFPPSRYSGSLYDTPDASPAVAANSFTRVLPYPTIFQTSAGQPQQQTFGGVSSPHVRRGARMQMTYREDDLSLDYDSANQFNIDIEQMHWAPWNDQDALFDTFDNYTMLLGHSEKRPDRLFYVSDGGPLMLNPDCEMDCASHFSGLSLNFRDNPLDGTEMVAVVDEAVYTVMPALSFRSPATGVRYVPYAEFERTYTWRDSRLVSWNMTTDRPIGLGGALDAATDAQGTLNNPTGGDRTASVSSPWTPNDPSNSIDGDILGPAYQRFCRDPADFLGDRTQDHDPIALPLLVEWQVRPDDTINSAPSFNEFWMAYMGAPYVDVAFPGATNGGYFNSTPGPATQGDSVDLSRLQCGDILNTGLGLGLPFLRVHSTGGTDLVSQTDVFINPPDEPRARGGSIIDLGLGSDPLGLFTAPPGDSSIYWTQVDFIRKTSMMTFGFFDTFQPNRFDGAALQSTGIPLPANSAGVPNFLTQTTPQDLGIGQEIIVETSPAFPPGGTTITVELRGVDRIGPDSGMFETQDPGLYDPLADDNPLTRGNLYNPNYACEAYRYAATSTFRDGTMVPRVEAEGFTPYVTEEDLDSIRNVRGILPRYMNMRVVMENNIVATPTVSPSLEHVYIVYRMTRPSSN